MLIPGAKREDLSNQRGVVMLEGTFAIIIYTMIFVFIIDAGNVFYRYSNLTSTTEALTRDLAVELGHGLSSGAVSNCSAFLTAQGDAFLAKEIGPGNYSMSDTSAMYSFSAAVITDPLAPCAILRIVGSLQPSCLACVFFPKAVISAESSQLIEWNSNGCS